MNKWLLRVKQRNTGISIASGDKVDIVNDNSKLSTMSPYTSCVTEKQSIAMLAKEVELRELVLSLQRYYGGDKQEWIEHANDVIHDWSHDLDSAITCYRLVHDEQRSVINRQQQEDILV